MTPEPGARKPGRQTGGPARGRRPERGPGGRRRASHSLDAVLTEAVALLDKAGEPALTFRALAARLGGGVGSIYWYVSSKDELLDRAADFVMDQVLADTDAFATDDPIDDLRRTAIVLYGAVSRRPWLGTYFMRNTPLQPHSLRYYERIGQQVLRLGLTPRETFHGASAVVGFTIGIAADLGQEPPEEFVKGEITREEFFERAVASWRELDPQEWPFLHTIIDEFVGHDDEEQFRAGLDLILAGLRLQADVRRAQRGE